MPQRRVLAWSLCLLLVANAAAAQSVVGILGIASEVRPFDRQRLPAVPRGASQNAAAVVAAIIRGGNAR